MKNQMETSGKCNGNWDDVFKGTLLGTPNWEPQEYSRYIIGIYLPGSLYAIIFLLYSWGSLFGVPIRVPLVLACRNEGFQKLESFFCGVSQKQDHHSFGM